MNPLYDLKQYQKDLAEAIRLTNRKNLNIDYDPEIEFCKKYGLRFIPKTMSYEFRHNHIAYCELRGRSREQIEKPSDNNLPNEDYITKIKTHWMEKINENVCTSSN